MGHAQDSCSGFVVGKQWTRSQGDLPHMDYYVNQETNILGLNNSPRKLGHMVSSFTCVSVSFTHQRHEPCLPSSKEGPKGRNSILSGWDFP